MSSNDTYFILEKVAINDALPLKTGRRDAIAKLKFFGASNLSCRQIQCCFIKSLWGATLMPLRACAMDWERNKILRVGKNSSPILSHLWTKVYERLCPIVYVVVFQKLFAIKYRSRRKTEQMQKFFGPQFFSGKTTPTFLRQIVSAT